MEKKISSFQTIWGDSILIKGIQSHSLFENKCDFQLHISQFNFKLKLNNLNYKHTFRFASELRSVNSQHKQF